MPVQEQIPATPIKVKKVWHKPMFWLLDTDSIKGGQLNGLHENNIVNSTYINGKRYIRTNTGAHSKFHTNTSGPSGHQYYS